MIGYSYVVVARQYGQAVLNLLKIIEMKDCGSDEACIHLGRSQVNAFQEYYSNSNTEVLLGKVKYAHCNHSNPHPNLDSFQRV